MKHKLTSHQVTKSPSHKIKIFFVTCVLVSLCPCVLCLAQPVSSTELINNAKQYDGKTVIFAGEVIGDVMARGEFAWVNVNDGANAIGVWIDRNLAKDIFYAASYKSKGDTIEVAGVFHRACLEHGGDLDIHAQGFTKVRTGSERPEKVDIHKRNSFFLLLGLLCLVLILRQLRLK